MRADRNARVRRHRTRKLGCAVGSWLAVLAASGCDTAPPASPQADTGSQALLVRLGDDMRRNGDLAGAMRFYQAALARDEHDATALQHLGDALLASGEAATAEQTFRAALAVMPEAADAQRGLAVVLLAQGHPAEALPLLAQLAATAADPRLLRDEGVALDMLGRSAEAQAAYRAGLQLAPLDPDLHGNLALSLALGGDAAGALREMRAAIASPRPDPRQEANAVLLLALLGQTETAQARGRAVLGEADTTALLQRAARARAATGGAARAIAVGVMAPGQPATEASRLGPPEAGAAVGR